MAHTQRGKLASSGTGRVVSDWLDTPEAKAWAKHCLDEVVPMIDASAMSVSLVPRGETDIKFAVELGLSLMLDKPIVLVVHPGTRVPAALVSVATEIVECDLSTSAGRHRVAEAIARIIEGQR